MHTSYSQTHITLNSDTAFVTYTNLHHVLINVCMYLLLVYDDVSIIVSSPEDERQRRMGEEELER